MQTPTEIRNPVIELLEDRLQAAMQIIAAIVLTDDEGLAFCKEWDHAHPTPEWIKSMRGELLGSARPELMVALKRMGFLANSHTGFVLPFLTTGPVNHAQLNAAYMHLDRILSVYARGGGDSVAHDARESFWSARLQEAGFPVDVADWVMSHGGVLSVCDAEMTRMMLSVKGT